MMPYNGWYCASWSSVKIITFRQHHDVLGGSNCTNIPFPGIDFRVFSQVFPIRWKVWLRAEYSIKKLSCQSILRGSYHLLYLRVITSKGFPYPEPVVFQWQSSGNPVCMELRPQCTLECHWRNASVLPVVFQWLSSGLPVCSNYAN